jgi:glycosyltransferase involved in cell wall biosynthesis
VPNQLNILGTRGIPGAHGGFETFAERLAPWLVSRGWDVTVYCQGDTRLDADMKTPREDSWQGVHRVTFDVRRDGAAGTMEFDLACVRDVVRRPGIDLVLGYNTAVFNLRERLAGRRVVMNMDGIEWKRQKWSLPAKLWLLANEIAGYNLAHVAIADHPEIARHLRRRGFKQPVMIPYGADLVVDAPTEPLTAIGIEPGRYYVAIGRLEPENSILEVVRSFAATPRAMRLVMLGKRDPNNAYHRAITQAAGNRVIFPGPIYNQDRLRSIRFHARAYVHGHQVGGTNPSLVEALGAGNAVIAHDNRFNRWTAGEDQFFFTNENTLADLWQQLDNDETALTAARQAARARHAQDFRWDMVLEQYQQCLEQAAATTR